MKLARLALGVIFLVIVGCGSGGDADPEQLATKSAEKWLEVLDKAEYGKSWQEAAGFFQSAVTMVQWEQSIAAARQPLGAVISRQLQSATYATTLPGAPDGEYVVIIYDTQFANKQAAVETITPMLDSDGKWRVSGYFVN